MKKKILRSLIIVLVLALTCIYALPGVFSTSGNDTDVDSNVNASFNFDKEEILSRLKAQTVSRLNKDLLKRVDENKLTGAVDVIITLSEGSLVGQFNARGRGQLNEFLNGSEARETAAKALSRQEELESLLKKEGLITATKYHYTSILDGFSATTTYENLSKLLNHDGVYRVIISDTYNPQVEAVENKVNVYDTGIFNSDNDGDYTGKGTIVAILDTGCDYAHPAFTTHQVERPLYDSGDIAEMLPGTVAYRNSEMPLEARDVYYGNITKDKIAFGYDYADNDPDVMPMLESHGTHVAGIIGGYADDSIWEQNDDFEGSHDTVLRGVAIDTQLAIMKVFSDYDSGAQDVDIMAALEDCVNLNVDAINMSLGTSCGFSREVDEEYKNDIYDRIEAVGISLVVAASNDYSSAMGSEFGNTNKVENPDSGTVGAPSTYTGAMSVASINGNKDKYMEANGERTIFFDEAANTNSVSYNFFRALGVQADENKTFEYVTIPGDGSAANYLGRDVKGKIVLVRRGTASFEDKAMVAQANEAAGIIIYNNVYGDIIMTVGNDIHDNFGVCSIGKDDGEYLAEQGTGTIVLNGSNEAGPFMSDFSSWGPNPDLSLKPEITAHGGNIWSSIPGGGYEKLSGTSMASPNMCGITVLIRQYVKDKFQGLDAPAVRDMVNQLAMSTAIIALNSEGNPYSPRKQGAGIADIIKATTTNAYITVDGTNKAKLELKDDPERNGVYTMTFHLRNISDGSVSYKLGDLSMTESVTKDNKYVTEMAHMLNMGHKYTVTDGTLNGDVVTVAANKTATITVELTLNNSDKSYINEHFPNGMFVEGFITLTSQDGGVDLNVPYLAFYGDWTEAPIFDTDYYEVETTAHNNAIDDEDKIKADYYATTPYALYYYDYIVPLGMYLYDQNPDYEPIPATEEHAALSYYVTSLSGIYAVYAGLLRGAKEMDIQIVDTSTGEVVWTDTEYNIGKAHYSGQAIPGIVEFDLNMAQDDGSVFGVNNSHYEVTMTARLDWDGESRNVRDTYKFSFYVDYEAPTVTGSRFYSKYNQSTREMEYYVDLDVYDNHYAMGVNPVVVSYAKDENGDPVYNNGTRMISLDTLSEAAIPVLQETRGSTTTVTVEITNYLDRLRNSIFPNTIMFQVDDYALNSNLVCIDLPEVNNGNLAFGSYDGDKFSPESEIPLRPGQTKTITDLVVGNTVESNKDVNRDFLFMLDWSSSDDSVVTVHNGVIEGISEGSATVSFVSNNVRKSITVKVEGDPVDDSNNRDNAYLNEVKFTHYTTNFAFNSDVSRSYIGATGDDNYFEDGATPSVTFYPSERITLHYNIDPWNLQENTDRYTLDWSTNNPRVATVDQNGVVTAVAEGSAAIFLRITIDGRQSTLQGRCNVTVNSEFVVEGSQLVAYKGQGGVVEIPDDEGIIYIASYAFCHYNLDNAKEVDDRYDIDAKKEPLGNNTVTKVIIPESVTTIDNYAFYNSKLLEEVEIKGDKLVSIGQHAFEKCDRLKKINLDHVNVIAEAAFKDCSSLADVGEGKLNHPFALGSSAFENCVSLTEVNLANLRRGGTAVFRGTTKLASVTLGKMTRISESMFERSGISSTARRPLDVYSDIVPARAFYGCAALRGVRFVNDVSVVDDNAFARSALTSVKFEGNCEAFGLNPFENCNITDFSLPNSIYVSEGVAYDSEAMTKLLYATPSFTAINFTLPASVEEIAEGAFSGTTLRSFAVATGSQLRVVGIKAFAGCTSLNSLTLPATVEVIGSEAFEGTAIRSIDLGEADGLTSIGYGAFFACRSLQSVVLPDSCTTIEFSAFSNCMSLNSINLSKVTDVGNEAFYNTALSTVDLSSDNVTVGRAAFAGNIGDSTIQLSSVRSLTLGNNAVIGSYAFAANRISTLNIEASNVVIDGEFAFAFSSSITQANISGVTKLGDYAFAQCSSLASVVMTNVVEIGEGAFMMCTSLRNVESPNLEKIGMGAFYPNINESTNRVTPIPLTSLNLEKVTEIGEMAFYYSQIERLDMPALKTVSSEAFIGAAVKEVNAPNLTTIDDFAFAFCEDLTTFNAPKLERVGERAFLGTAIVNMELTDSLVNVGGGMFSDNSVFEGFTYNGESTAEGANFILEQGVLYIKLPNGGLKLAVYPATKTDASYTVREGTVRIESYAAQGNTNLTEVTLPATLRTIGDYAFDGCTKLGKVIFRSHTAPTLEGTMTADVTITPSTQSSYPGFGALYQYDFYYRLAREVSWSYGNILGYSNFVGFLGSKDAIDIEIPQGSEGYDSLLYQVFFNEPSYGEPSALGKYAIAFIDAVNALPEVIDRFAASEIGDALNAYNLLVANGEQSQVEKAILDRYNAAVAAYDLDVARDAIVKLHDMDATRHNYDALKRATELYNALTSEQKAQLDGSIDAANVLAQKKADLAQAMGIEVDLSKDWNSTIVNQLRNLAGDLTPDKLTVDDYDVVKQIYTVINTLTAEDQARMQAELAPYQALVDAWNNVASVDISGAVTTARKVAGSVIGGAIATAAFINGLFALAYVVTKGGIL